MSPILIGIHGVKRAGKDTTADFFTKFAEESDPALAVVRRGFADKGKWAFARQFFPDITLEEAVKWVDEYKESARVFRVPGRHGKEFTLDVPFRNALAQFCTEGARDIYGDDFWVDQLLPLSHVMGRNDVPLYPRWHESFESLHRPDGPGPADVCLIRDLRFQNEIVRIAKLGGITIKVKRKDAEDAVIEEARKQGREIHRSELGLDDEMFDYIIDNSDNNLDNALARTRDVWGYINGC